MKIFAASGTDANAFVPVLILAESYQQMRGEVVNVCDFGMTPAQVKLLSQYANVLPRPEDLAGDIHPYKMKSALSRYVSGTGESYDAFAWIDADMVVLPGFSESFEEQVARQLKSGKLISAAPDDNDMSLGEFCIHCTQLGQDLRYFEKQISDRGIEKTNAYFNCGFFICLEYDFLEDWRQTTWQTTDSCLIDQNAFNIVAYSTGNVDQLSRAKWNAHGRDLGKVVPSVDRPGSFLVDGQRSYAVHATSEGMRFHEHRVVNWAIDDVPYAAEMKLFRNPSLQKTQIDYFLAVLKRTDTPLLTPFLAK